ncbi:MAG: hypothetical protein AUK37_04440 [Rhodobacterales bacterium CG2_30_65_12]|nr:MAG: hypothetical protein AUK37_04440 [Rhodobacterales bacterium CG2_30_65_12]
MRRVLSFLSLIFVLPLAACFDAEMTVAFPDEDNAVGTMVITATPEFYAMATSSGDPFCEGEDAALEDGSHSCTEIVTGTIDEFLADPDMSEGLAIERRDGGLLYVAFDLSEVTQDVAPPEEEGTDAEQMRQMMMASFIGHKIAINIAGAEIIETNGTVSDDGTTARFEIPLETLLDSDTELPDTFNALVKPGT